MNNQRIVPHLWFDNEAQEAVDYYMQTFPESEIISDVTFTDTPSGDAKQLTFNIFGYKFMAINAGPYFTKNPSISFTVLFNQSEAALLDKVWTALAHNGEIMMELDTYDFSEKYGWLEDQFGVSWQLLITDQPFDDRIRPSFMFINENVGRAEEAINYYTSVFKNSGDISKFYYPEGMEPDKPDTLAHAEFKLEDQYFVALDSAHKHEFNLNEGISLMLFLEDQQEIDYYWDKLSAVPEAEQCGWVKDQFGVSWQIVPKIMDQMAEEGTPEQISNVTKAFLKMKKFDVETLIKVYEDNL
ncbi:VOC family protein [Mammaliicoccus sciuri]|uniref:VOC family protein n=1 Tax=Mammaliicoccus sciuri TaxID=1296 RepID=UPI0015E5D7BF|nr:VOC family protein [Mammaliicoccus sciuri]MBA1397727.1 VOC family protein [Mammaliicoccus sciuri]MBO1207485.1 VOC family protein [Mammaliicoccus sciuri]MCD8823872.1 VOC family protein [Mammaliicoccus sciuri]MEB8072898.1 VOC family protein [Mammaliicoccus sciuri]MEB8129896.1 VOC family protein [Mammaliicoccus sciuri]